MKDYSELKRLSEAATPGPWFDDDGFVRAESGLDIVESCSGCPMRPNDTAFVSAANPAVVLALIAEIEALRGVMAAVVSEIPRERYVSPGNSPGHSHRRPGIWDEDNGAKAGKECGWCKVWNTAIAMSKDSGHD